MAGLGGQLPPVPAEGAQSLTMISSRKQGQMKHVATIALMATLAIANIYAQEYPVKMLFSGHGAASPVNLNLPNTKTGEQNLAGNGTLGLFTFRIVRAGATSPQPSSACSGLFFPVVAGAGVFRFQDGSLLKVALTQGSDCIDLVAMEAHSTMTLQITGGTGRFNRASGVLTLTETVRQVMDASNNPVLSTDTGELTGMISVGSMDEESQ
jgi:hypothetical protein